MSSYMADVFDLDLEVDTVTVVDSDEDDIIEIDEVNFCHYLLIHNSGDHDFTLFCN